MKLLLFLLVFIPMASIAEMLRHPYAYLITSPHGSQSMIFGTIHGGVPLTDVPQSIRQKLRNSNSFLIELNFSDQEINSVLSGKRVEVQLQNYNHKGEELSAEFKRKLISEWKVDPRLAEKAKSQDCEILLFSGPVNSGFMDLHFLHLARKQKKRIVSLDSKELFREIEQSHQQVSTCDLRQLTMALTPEDIRNSQINTIEAYRTGAEPDFFFKADASIEKRNRAWLPKILEELQKGDAFIAVGVAHLHGSEGLLQHFTDNGYRIERIR